MSARACPHTNTSLENLAIGDFVHQVPVVPVVPVLSVVPVVPVVPVERGCTGKLLNAMA